MKQVNVKRIFSLLMAIAIVLSLVPVSAYAQTTEEVPGTENVQTEVIPGENADNGADAPEELPGEGENPGEGEDTEVDIDSIAVDVFSADELALALADGQRAIRIREDFVIDRTFYVTADTAIFTDEAHTLTRGAAFGGDIFVIGENAAGEACEGGVTLTLGHPDSGEENLLTIDGNKANMTVPVTGSAIFVVGGSHAALYPNLTVTNCKKEGNEKTLTENYGVSYPETVGGAVAILSAKSSMDIFGGIYSHNEAMDIVETDTETITVSAYGGAFYNFGTLNVYGGTFEGNHAARGGAFYCYRTLRIYNAQISGNTASTYGGAIYMPNSTSAYLFIGGENGYVDSQVTFRENSAVSGGGAIYARNKLEAQDVRFISNSVTGGSGGGVTATSTQLSFTNATFDGNTAKNYGGAIYYATGIDKEDVYDLTCVDVTFSNNSVSATGGAVYMNGGAIAQMENATFTANTASNNGGAIYLNNGHVTVAGGNFAENKANAGGAVCMTNEASFNIDGGSFTQNSGTTTGGAIHTTGSATVRVNAVTASGNASKSGGFAYAEDNSGLYIYDSTLQENTATGSGGAVHMITGAFGGVYNTTFHKNISGSSGGALYIYTSGYDLGSKVVLHSCTYTENEGVYGGAIYTAKQSVIDLLNSTAKFNKAKLGGFMYHTAYDTTVNLASLILEGNTATDGGPIMYGNTYNAALNLDKALYIDRDYTGEMDDAYWTYAIANKMTVNDVVLDIPNYIGYDGTEVVPVVPRIPVEITSSQELADALAGGKDLLHITADFEIDRTFYIWRNTTIYTTEAHTLTRAAGFGGDIFVVGEHSAGDKADKPVTLELGDPESTANNLLTINGNKANMTVTVTGSVIFVVGGSNATLYPNLTVTNCKKDGNEKTLTGDYGVSYVDNVGGAVAIVSSKASMDIFGGIYSNNETNDVTTVDGADVETSTHGGAFYNYGTLNVYGGTFEGNHAAKGSVFYCYRTTNIYNAVIRNNTASSLGGAIYMPNSTAAKLYLGGENDYVTSSVLFQGNSAPSGGAIYAKNIMDARNTRFVSNSATTGSGGSIYTGAMVLTLKDTVFEENTAAKYGAAIYYAGANEKEGIDDLTCENVTFSNNSVSASGGAIYMNGNATARMTNTTFSGNSAKNNGGAIYLNNGHVTAVGGSFTENSTVTGGAVALTNGASLEADGTSFDSNTATGNGGAISAASATLIFNKITATENSGKGGFAYMEESSVTMYRSRLEGNTSTSNGGAFYMQTGASGSIYATDFVSNEAAGTSTNGGALALYTGGGEVLIHSCTFTGNSATNFGGAIWISGKTLATIYNITARTNSAAYGGFMYHTAAGTVVDMAGVTVSGNTAANGPIIWGNTTNAVMNLDKSQFVDENHTGAMDSAYWTATIANKLKVNDVSQEIPKWLDYGEEAYDHMASAVDVSNADELEAAIDSGAEYIRIIADITVDRTFFIWRHTTIFSTLPRTLTRDPAFGGDFFVVGENAEGVNAILLGSGAKLTLGNPLSQQENLLTIDGNKDNMTVPVKGSGLFISFSGIAELHTNVTAVNMYKSDNDRAYIEHYPLSRPNRVGGALAIVAGGTLNIYGGNYRNNQVNVEDASSEETRNSTAGGLIYNQGNLNIHDGTFENNQGARGGVVYNYRALKILGGRFIGNVGTVTGSVIYAPNAVTSHTHIGSADAEATPVLFQNNSGNGNGGVIYQAALCTLVIYGNTTFDSNTAASSGGAICAYGSVTIRDTVFTGNRAKTQGGAIYFANSSSTYLTRRNLLENCTFTDNQATHGGAVSLYSSDSEFETGAILEVRNSTFSGNIAAAAASKSTASYGGAFYLERKSSLTLVDSVLKENQARTEGGAIYASGASTIAVTDTQFTNNAVQEKGKHGGAVSVHSVTLTAQGTTFSGNTAPINGGGLYVSYSGSYDRNSEVTLTDVDFRSNTAEELGGALYVTKQTVTEEKRILTASNPTFSKNSAISGGAAYFCAGVDAYLTDATFTGNEATDDVGGAITASGSILELDTATFTGNSAAGSGGGMHISNQAQVVLYNITAEENQTDGGGGFAYCTEASLTMYDSALHFNLSQGNGGGVALYGGADAKIYNTTFTDNAAEANGGAVFLYTNLTPCLLHSCTFTGNDGTYGGAVYASGKAVATMYNSVARSNTSSKGGFLYHTTTDTDLTLAGVTVSGNTATSGGPIIWGNSTGAVLHIDKSRYTDEDLTGEMDEAYWSAAIYNKLTVDEISAAIPGYDSYVSKREDDTQEPVVKDPVPVEELFYLSQHSSDADINKTYGALPRLDNSSNFMSKNVTTFDNINGGTVTVDTFVYPARAAADNCNVGLGLLVWQAMCYKQAFPEEEVYIDVSSYRFSVQAAININRDSRYFGYMRQLYGTENYDQYGFVRIAYLLVSAAKMGIHVNAIGHIDAYPVSDDSLKLNDYFTTQLADPCDPAYVENGVIGDYLTFTKIDWDLQEKGGTDMMHTKMCTVSHYLDMNGVVHRNAVFTSSSNLDGINGKGVNANWKLQTATIVSGHEAIYRIAVNYLRMMPQYRRQEGVYEFQDQVRTLSTQQAQLILAGRESEIPETEQIIYLGRDTDPVFELYFTPFGGETLAWNEVQNPYCKYMRKLYDSEDYILFTWNAAEYSSGFAFGDQLEAMLIAAFHENRNVNNRIYGRMENFDTTTFDDLQVGVDIGYKSFNSLAFDEVHNKDLQFSYVENGQRYYVSLLNSLNFHSGSMFYQSNFALVIKETECKESSVFFSLADLSTTGIVEHDYGEEQNYMPEDETLDGYTYRSCRQCDKELITGTLHRLSDWIIDREASAQQEGIRHRECLVCGERADSSTFAYEALDPVELELASGRTFTADSYHPIALSQQIMPATFEATLQVSPSLSGRGGVILGNYEKYGPSALSLEVYTHGRIRLYFINEYQYVNHVFATDIRSEEPRHIALTVDGTTAALYVDGELKETAQLALPLPALDRGLVVGGDYRPANSQYFKGTLYSVSLFSDVRTPEQIRSDRVVVAEDAPALLYSEQFFAEAENISGYTAVAPATKTFDALTSLPIQGALSAGPKTFEATVLIPRELDSAGVILGNYGLSQGAQMYLEVGAGGILQLYYMTGEGESAQVALSQDIRSDMPIHIAVTIDGTTATTYINSKHAYTAQLPLSFPEITEGFVIGGDNRAENTQFFRGSIHSVSMFSDVRTPEEILWDMLVVPSDQADLVHSTCFIVSTEALDSSFSSVDSFIVEESLSAAPLTFQATIRVPTTMKDRAGVIVGNYDGSGKPQINLEIYYGGRVRLFYMVNYSQKADCLFNTDIRSDEAVHIAVTVSDGNANLYVNGVWVETQPLSVAYPSVTDDFRIGGDNRTANALYFKGSLYGVSLFDHARTQEQILADMAGVDPEASGLLLNQRFGDPEEDPTGTTSGITGKTFTATTSEPIEQTFDSAPKTLEAIIHVPTAFNDRVGTIVGNYDGSGKQQINLEVYFGGKIRLYLNNGSLKQTVAFQTDIRSDGPVHLAVTLEDTQATLYVGGDPVETAALSVALPAATARFRVGGDNRKDNSQYFKGIVYAVSLFDHVRTLEQIRQDTVFVNPEEEGVLYTSRFTSDANTVTVPVTGGVTFSPDRFWDAPQALSAAPQTLEATLCLPKSVSGAGGTILGNYGAQGSTLNLEMVDGGKLQLSGESGVCTFVTDIRSDAPVHIAITVSDGVALLYINGTLAEQAKLAVASLTATEGFRIGGDLREGNTQYFRGTIYSVYLFSNVRTQEQIRQDVATAPDSDAALVLVKKFDHSICSENTLGFDHVEGDWILDRDITDADNGLMHSVCALCGKTLRAGQVTIGTEDAFWLDLSKATGLQPEAPRLKLAEALSAMPKTYEFTLQLPTNFQNRGGVVLGNYNGGNGNFLNMEIYYNGRPRVWFKIDKTAYSYTFTTDLRSQDPTHVAITVDGLTASLYVNGVWAETITLAAQIPETLADYYIGTDNRPENPQAFQGTIYGISLFDHVRTPEQIACDAVLVSPNEAGLICSHYFQTEKSELQ